VRYNNEMQDQWHSAQCKVISSNEMKHPMPAGSSRSLSLLQHAFTEIKQKKKKITP